MNDPTAVNITPITNSDPDILFEGTVSKLGSDYASIVISGDKAFRTSYWHEHLNGRRVRVVIADRPIAQFRIFARLVIDLDNEARTSAEVGAAVANAMRRYPLQRHPALDDA